MSNSGLPYSLKTIDQNRLKEIQQSIQIGTVLPVMEHFYTIQGEGGNAGIPAYFIRIGGCDVGCFWCDVKESWESGKHPLYSIDQLVGLAAQSGARLAVITGGEPLMYNMQPLVSALSVAGFRVALETSGAYPLTGSFNWICFSPKKFKKPLDVFYEVSNELKVIVYNQHDFQWAEEHKQKMNKNAVFFLQPEWEKKDEMLPRIIQYVKQNPDWRISLQTHKYMQIP